MSSRSTPGDKLPRDCELPGFHFDAVKKKYFRILPSQNNVMAGVVTSTSVDANSSKQVKSKLLQSREHQLRHLRLGSGHMPSCNFVDIIHDRQIGQPCKSFERIRMLSTIAHNLTWHASTAMTVDSDVYTISHIKQFCTSKNCDQIAFNWHLQTDFSLISSGDVLQRVNICHMQKKHPHRFELECSSAGYQKLNTMRCISSMCYAVSPFILYTEIVQKHFSDVNSIAALDSVNNPHLAETDSTSGSGLHIYNIGKKWIWSSAWNDVSGKHFAIGTEKQSLLFDVESGHRFILNTHNSDGLSQAFSCASNDVLYTGTRSGIIYCYKGHKCVNTLHQGSSVYSIYAARDGHHLISADLSGKITNWDTRQNRIVLQYDGHVKESAVFTTFGVDQSESFLFAVGSDGVTRIWFVKTGELLTYIVPPHPVTKNSLPSVCFSETFGQDSFPGLILGIRNEIHFYTQ